MGTLRAFFAAFGQELHYFWDLVDMLTHVGDRIHVLTFSFENMADMSLMVDGTVIDYSTA